MENKRIVSFDFDDTLSNPPIQEYAKLLIEQGVEVWIVTSRYDSPDKYQTHFLKTIGVTLKDLQKQWDELFVIADKVGIDREHIVFTNMNPKYTYFKDHPEFIWHLDDSFEEIRHINEFTMVKGISWVGNRGWQVECSKLLFD